jgi:hydroxymethylglutaryl-CoA lyase
MREIDILISEVGPRDGLQSIQSVMPTAAKKAWIEAEAAAGVREIEVGSFVPPKLLPQLADTGEIVSWARNIPGLTVAALVPNFKGAENAIKAGAHKITLPLSVSETHSQANLRKTHAQVLDEVRRIVELIDSLPADERPAFEGGLSTAFGCTLEGKVPEAKVVDLARQLIELGCDEVGLSDTTGYANPASAEAAGDVVLGQLVPGLVKTCSVRRPRSGRPGGNRRCAGRRARPAASSG